MKFSGLAVVFVVFGLFLAGCASQKSLPPLPGAPGAAAPKCTAYSSETCPSPCVACPPCAECSSISCQSEQFCNSIGFDRSWYGGMKNFSRNFSAVEYGNSTTIKQNLNAAQANGETAQQENAPGEITVDILFDGSLFDMVESANAQQGSLYTLHAPQYAMLGGKPILFYEIYVPSRLGAGMNKVEALSEGRVLKTIAGDELNKSIRAPKANINDYAVYMWVPLNEGDKPASVSHKVYFEDGSAIEGANVNVNYTAPIVISPPVYGENWLAAEAPVNTNHHRKGLFGLTGGISAGTPVVSQRYAIDFMQYGPNGKLYKESGQAALTNEDFWCYGKEIHAVADGEVVDARNDIQSNVPFTQLPPVSLVTVAGNNVVQEIGDTGIYALYAHMIPGSLRVKIGDKVKKGDVLGLLGNTGNSDAPHLHFHLDTSKDALFGEGVPYAFESYAKQGNADWKTLLGTNQAWNATSAQVNVNMAMPVDGDVVTMGPKESGSLVFVSAFEKGTKYITREGSFTVLDLHGSFREMGRQYGYLMKGEMQSAYNETMAETAKLGMPREYVDAAGDMLYNSNSEKYVELMEGMSETSGLTLQQHKELNGGVISLIEAYTINVSAQSSTSRCSGVAFWGNYSKDGKLYFGRNWDMVKSLLSPYLKYMTLAVYHPEGTSNIVANLEWVGETYTETAMNDKGLFLELNNGGQSDPSHYRGRAFAVVKLFDFMFDSSDMRDISREFNTTLASESYVIQVADKSSAYSFEWPTFGVNMRSENVSGLLVAYNSFVPPYPKEWEGKVVPPNPGDVRRSNFLAMANSAEYKGKMDEKLMQKFLAVPFAEGGGMLPDNVYQVIAVPEDYKMWLHGQNYSGWEEIDLKPFFNK